MKLVGQLIIKQLLDLIDKNTIMELVVEHKSYTITIVECKEIAPTKNKRKVSYAMPGFAFK